MRPKQKKIIRLLAVGYSQKEIATKLHTSPESINNRIKYMRKKTGTKTVVHLVVDCLQIELWTAEIQRSHDLFLKPRSTKLCIDYNKESTTINTIL